MFEVVQSYWAPKTPGFEHEYEDAADWNTAGGMAAIADGVSTAIYSRDWADILTTAVVTSAPVEPGEPGNWTAWLAPHRKAWAERINLPQMLLDWRKGPKIRQVEGGWITLLWLQLETDSPPIAESTQPHETADSPDQDSPDQDAAVENQGTIEVPAEEDHQGDCSPTWRLTCHAIGDCNLFVVRRGRLQVSHPMQSSEAYAENPQAICALHSRRDGQLAIQSMTFPCEQDDMLILCTDAIGQWIWSELEQNGGQFDWERLSHWSNDEWHAEVQRLRGEKRMRIDDSTLVILRVGAEAPVPVTDEHPIIPAAEDAAEAESEPATVAAEPGETATAASTAESLESPPDENVIVAETASETETVPFGDDDLPPAITRPAVVADEHRADG